MKTIVVTAVGGDIGLPVARILTGAGHTVIGCDASTDNASRAFIDDVRVVPPGESSEYRKAIAHICTSAKADALIVNAESELQAIGDLQTAIPTTKILALDPELVGIFCDKLETARWLDANGLPAPPSTPLGDGASLALPTIVKRRRGSGGRDLVHVRAPEDWPRLTALGADFFAQEEIGNESEEYTCGVFRALGETRVIAFRRRLAGGITHRGQVVDDASITAVCERVAEAADLTGALNVQLRLQRGRPVIFEINPRFSSTVLFRHMLGFTDVLWWLDALDGVPPGPFPTPVGTRIYRTGLEVTIAPDGTAQYAAL